MSAIANVDTVITGWSAISPFGFGGRPFGAGVTAGRRTRQPIDHDTWPVPDDYACLVPDFDVQELLGKKGTRALNRTTALAVATTGRVLGVADGTGDHAPPASAVAANEGTALVLGTTTGSAQSMMDFTRDSLVGARPYLVEPAFVPNGVMNVAAARCAIWHGLKGPNLTIATGRAAGVSALCYARRLLVTGRAERALAGGVEEFSTARAWLQHHSGLGGGLLGEGCALFMLEPRTTASRPALAELLATGFRTCVDGDVTAAVRAVVQATLARGRTEPGEVFLACPSGAAHGAERDGLAEVVTQTPIERVPDLIDLIADTAAASAAFQLAAILSVAQERGAAGKLALITAADPDGAVTCALLRIAGGTGE